MNLYLVSRTDKAGYDEYDAFVIAEVSEESARGRNPVSNAHGESYYKDGEWHTLCWDGSVIKECGSGAWADPSTVTVELIGTTDKSAGTRILASFNAG